MAPLKQPKRLAAVFLLIVASVIGSRVPATAATFDAAADFSLAGNPNGPWSYLYSNTLLPSPQTSGNIEYWWSGQAVPNSIIVGRAIIGTAASGTVQFGSTYLTMDPESQTVDVRFTAPTAGSYTITGQFFGADDQTNCGTSCASHPVLITDSVDGTIFGPQTISTFLQSFAFNLTVNLLTGEQVDFLAQTGTGGCAYCNLSTGLQALITTAETPLPATLPLFAGGLGFVTIIAQRRKRKTPNAA